MFLWNFFVVLNKILYFFQVSLEFWNPVSNFMEVTWGALLWNLNTKYWEWCTFNIYNNSYGQYAQKQFSLLEDIWHFCTTRWQQFIYTDREMSSFWRNYHRWQHWKLSKWQLPVQPVMKILSKWQHFHFNVGINSFSEQDGACHQSCGYLRAIHCLHFHKSHVMASGCLWLASAFICWVHLACIVSSGMLMEIAPMGAVHVMLCRFKLLTHEMSNYDM